MCAFFVSLCNVAQCSAYLTVLFIVVWCSLACSFVECGLVYLFFSLHAVCSPLGRIFNIATNVSFVSCSFLRCSRCSFPCVFSLVYIVIVFVHCFICSFNRTVSFRSALKIALELVSISRQWQLHN